MKKYFLIVSVWMLWLGSCTLMQHKSYTPKDPLPENKQALPFVEKPAYYSKYYQFKTGQSYTRAVERAYYGMQAEMLQELNKYNIKKGFNIEDYNKYSKASFFQTDVYEIPADMKSKAVDLFRPLLDSMFLLAAQHRSFHAEILILGYTDEAAVPYNTPFYNQLLKLSKQKYFYNNDYYNTLSYFRAKEVGDIISDLLAKKKSSFYQFDKATFDIIVEGRGIEYPDAKRTYDLEDDKRKITKVYWKVYQSE